MDSFAADILLPRRRAGARRVGAACIPIQRIPFACSIRVIVCRHKEVDFRNPIAEVVQRPVAFLQRIKCTSRITTHVAPRAQAVAEPRAARAATRFVLQHQLEFGHSAHWNEYNGVCYTRTLLPSHGMSCTFRDLERHENALDRRASCGQR